ncbi:hypothetical protein BDV59DRAFT_62732 [Aspergillus ambiguus]|uniref:uncharacterized protein n=1 Tax=Aspergillus ambiguus TaxID=176160 RepID=UPI003CCD6EF9
MYPWHGASNHTSSPALPPPAGPRLDQVPQLRWLPSMMSRTPNNPHGLSSNLQLSNTTAPVSGGQPPAPISSTSTAQNPTQPHPAVAVVIDAHTSLPSSSASDQSDNPATRDGLAVTSDPENTSLSATASDAAITGNDVDDDDVDDDLPAGLAADSDTPRKHGKRLTTKEEVSLFEICNRHAADFGQRSNLCKWWMAVTAEFTRDQGHPYSWHSVRRRVESMTKQRIKFLDDLREKGGGAVDPDDVANPRWRRAIDTWIPTWQRWEAAEAKRIEKRDSRRPRKRKDRPWESAAGTNNAPPPVGAGAGGGGGGSSWETPSSTVSVSMSMSPAQHGQGGAPAPPQNTIRLPPGFDNMFSNQPTTTTTHVASAPPAGAGAASSTPGGKENNSMMSAMLETLGKLNRHLDAAGSEPRSSPVVASVASNLGGRAGTRTRTPNGDDAGSGGLSATAIERLKQEIRQEMRAEWRNELEKDRAALEEKLDSVQRTQEMILEMLRQEPA